MQPQHVPRPHRCGTGPSRRSRSQLSISTALSSIQSLSPLRQQSRAASGESRLWRVGAFRGANGVRNTAVMREDYEKAGDPACANSNRCLTKRQSVVAGQAVRAPAAFDPSHVVVGGGGRLSRRRYPQQESGYFSPGPNGPAPRCLTGAMPFNWATIAEPEEENLLDRFPV
jgi:hypothetical protein